jgi:hypothetical protein
MLYGNSWNDWCMSGTWTVRSPDSARQRRNTISMSYTIACTHCDRPVLTTRQLTPSDWGSMRGHLVECPRWQGATPPEDIGDVLTNFRVRQVSDAGAAVPKPVCQLPGIETQYSIRFRVRDALRGAGQPMQADEFMARVRDCDGAAETMEIASDYVDID